MLGKGEEVTRVGFFVCLPSTEVSGYYGKLDQSGQENLSLHQQDSPLQGSLQG